MTSISDDFNRANAGTLGANWTDYAIGTALSIVSNTCRPAAAAANAASRHNTTLAVPHWARATVTHGTGDNLAGVAVRCDTGAFTQYFGGIDRTGGVVTSVIYQLTAGALVVLAQSAYTATTGVVTLYATGTTTTVLTLAIDGVQVQQVSDSTTPFSTQTRVGILAAGATTVPIIDDFSASDVATVPLAPTGLTATPGDTTIALAWTAPFDGMAAITDYVIEYSTDATNWTTFSDGTSTAVTATITGLVNGTAYFTRVSATNSTGTGATTQASSVVPYPQVTFIGAGAWSPSVTDGAAVAADFPAGYTAIHGDIAIVIAAGLHNNTTSLAPTTPSGYTLIDTRFQNIATYDIQITAYLRVLQTGDAAPTVTLPTPYSTSSGGMACHMLVFRNADPKIPQDATAVVSSGAAAASFTPTGITTVSEGAMVVSMVISGDDNALGLLAASEQGFTLRAGGASYDTTTGGDHAVGSATRSGSIVALTSQAAAPSQLTATDATAGTAYNYRWTGAGVDILVPGLGVKGDHNEYVSGRCKTGWAHASVGGNGNVDTQGHDTGTSSVAVGVTCGVAKGASVVPYRLITSDPGAGVPISVSRMLTGLAQMVTDYPLGSATRAIMYYSMLGYASGETDSDGHTVTSQDILDLTAAFKKIADQGIPVVTAAGNSGGAYNKTPQNIAATDDRFTDVGNCDAVTLDKSTTSSFGADVTIWAVASGTGTVEAGISSVSDVSVGPYDGTSEAAPVVAGYYAKLLQAHPRLTSTQCRQIALANATATGNVGAGSPTKLINTLYMPDGAIGASICPTWSETLVGNDAWAAITVALQPFDFMARRALMGNVPVMRAATR